MSARYEAAPLKTGLLLVGAAALLGMLAFRRWRDRRLAAAGWRPPRAARFASLRE